MPASSNIMRNGTSYSQLLSPSRQRLMDAARGIFLSSSDHHTPKSPPQSSSSSSSSSSQHQRRILRCFPLRKSQFMDGSSSGTTTTSITTPTQFHQTLVHKIRHARQRVYLASLYIGPGIQKNHQKALEQQHQQQLNEEQELLQAIQESKAPTIKILLDYNRALRPIPVVVAQEDDASSTSSTTTTTTTSAEACDRALQKQHKQQQQRQRDSVDNSTSSTSGVYLLSVLSSLQQQLLQNPYNEIAGVFHIKCYIVDNEMILSGANLSQEYFCDRTDRYLLLSKYDNHKRATTTATTTDENNNTNDDDGGCLIESYVAMMDAFCQHAQLYTNPHADDLSSTSSTTAATTPRTTRQELMDTLADIFTSTTTTTTMVRSNSDPTKDVLLDVDSNTDDDDDDPIVAYAVPTLQLPSSFVGNCRNDIPSDVDITQSLIATTVASLQSTTELRLASAYLNLTNDMIHAMTPPPTSNNYYNTIHLLTAGSQSHGFKVNPKKVGNKGQPWIPAVFDTLGRQCIDQLMTRLQTTTPPGTAAMPHSNHTTAQTTTSAPTTAMTPQPPQLWYYQRPNWTFHAKGMWFTSSSTTATPSPAASATTTLDNFQPNHNIVVGPVPSSSSLPLIHDASALCGVIHGSGNYGYRSALCDMESNLILVFPDHPGVSLSGSNAAATRRQQQPSIVQTVFASEWNDMCQHATLAESEPPQPLSLRLRLLLPFIQRFF